MHRVMARIPGVAPVALETDADLIAGYLDDAARYPGGHADALARPRSVEEVAAMVRQATRVLPVGARSSLTGGATPAGGIVLSTERMTGIARRGSLVTAGAGVTLQVLQQELASHGLWFPPVPTFLGATVGGAVSTNAAGAATFKYGATRAWVEGLTVVLASGGVLDLVRGTVTASADGAFVVEHGPSGQQAVRIATEPLPMPDVAKRSAGYHLAAGMDLVDLFIGAEGTLGVVVDATLRVQPRPAGVCWVLVTLPSEASAIRLTGDLREAAQAAWRDPRRGVDVAAIEHIDRRSLDVLREDGVDTRLGVTLPEGTDVVLLAQVELSSQDLERDVWRDVQEAGESGSADTMIGRLCRLLDQHRALASSEIVLPTEARRAAALVEFRESVPAGVNRRVSLAHARDVRIHKTAADMVVPFARFGDMMITCRDLFAREGLDIAVWGHISDGNVHPNVIPRSFDEVERGQRALDELARQVIAMGGCPLAEHGVGRNPTKQAMLALLYGESGIATMRRVKQCLDPDGKLAPGVLFPQVIRKGAGLH
ncbi:MAG: FAD-binding oxidoreductase [Acidobacteriota bacterium]